MKRTLIFKISCLFIFIINWSQVFSQDGSWHFFGLPDEEIESIAINPQNDSILYAGSSSDFSAGTFGSIFKSYNAGLTWDTLVYGLSVSDIVIDHKNINVVYAALMPVSFSPPGILKTTDGGANWFWSHTGITVSWELGVATLEINPLYTDTIYAGTTGPLGGRIYKSINEGLYWNDITNNAPPGLRDGILDIALNPLNPDVIFSTTNFSGNLYKSWNGGINWIQIMVPWQGYNLVRSIIIDPINPDIMYAAVGSYGLMKSLNFGFDWLSITNGLPINGVGNATMDPHYHHFLFIATDNGIYWTIDAGMNWFNIGLKNRIVYQLAMSSDGQKLYAATDSGIYRNEFPFITHIEKPGELILGFHLSQNYPNPFNSETHIEYTLPKSIWIKLNIYDLRGKLIKVLVNDNKQAGHHTARWNGKDDSGKTVASGVYIYHISSAEYTESRKLVYLK